MIVVVCLNPALDVTYHVADLITGKSHPVAGHHERAGGKGVNVARVLHQLGVPALVLGFLGGHRGALVGEDLYAAGVPARWTPIGGETRQTVTIVDAEATVLLEPGPQIAPAEWAAFLSGFTNSLAGAELVVVSGSLPRGVPVDAYAQLTTVAAQRSIRTIVDCSGAVLQAALSAHPYLAKPNQSEVATLRYDPTDGDPVDALVSAGAINAIVSMGGDGLLAATDGAHYRLHGPQVAGNPTGAGDALTASLAAGIVAGLSWPEILREAAAIAAGAVALPYAGGFDPGVAAEVRPQIKLEEL